MAKSLTHLCSLLIEDVYGELAAQVFRTLAQWGRITLATLMQHSDLPPRYIRQGLTILIQQHLIHHITPENETTTLYDVDWNGAYDLVRCGKIIAFVEERCGTGAGQVISNLLQLGHARIGDLEDAYKFGSKEQHAIDTVAEHINGEGQPNGLENGHLAVKPQEKKITSKQDLHSVLYQLLENGFITRVHQRTFYSNADRENEAEIIVKRTEFPDGKTTGPKAKKLFMDAINQRKRKWREEEDVITGDMYQGSVTNRSHPPQKRVKLNGSMANGTGRSYDGPTVTLQSNIVIKVNFNKCAVAMRSQQFERYATRYLGETTGKVYATLLLLLERKIFRCRDGFNDEGDDGEQLNPPTATTVEVLDALDPSLDLASAIASGSNDDGLVNGNGDRSSRIKNEFYDDDDDDAGSSSMASRNKRMKQVEQHLRLLADHHRGFADRTGTRGQGEWSVYFNTLTENLQGAEIETVISSRFGTVAARVVRLLKQKGRLDPKQIEEGCMIRKKDGMSILSTMQEVGLVETQEVPKDASRQPARAFYLWFFDQHRVAKMLLFDTYKAMSRLIERIQQQKTQRQGIIDKAERLDVIGHEDEFLTTHDKQYLREWREEEEKLLTQLMRQDDMVALFRDF